MRKILFVCHGNICRSVMAQNIMLSLLKDRNKESCFIVDSAATSTEEISNPIYPPARDCLLRHNIKICNHRARQVTKKDYDYFDVIYCMDNYNFRNLMRFYDNDRLGKIKMLSSQIIDDPWYTNDFETAYNQIYTSITKLLDEQP